MSNLVLPRKKEHPDWIKVGTVAVDSGTIHIGDIDCGPDPSTLLPDKWWDTDGHGTVIRALFGDDVYDVFVQVDMAGGVERVLIEFGTWEDDGV